MTENGIDLIKTRAPLIVGPKSKLNNLLSQLISSTDQHNLTSSPPELIDPDNLCFVFVSPRQRAKRTFELLFENLSEAPSHIVTEDVREWDYGDYEGLKRDEILGLDKYWSIWRTGYVFLSMICG